MSDQIELLKPSTIENIDFAIYDWLDKELNLFTNTKDGFSKVPVIWVSPERSFQVKKEKEFRDLNGALSFPRITIERTSIEKDQKNAATYYANFPPKDNRIFVSRKINQKKTSEFANADFKRKFGEVGFLTPRKNQKVVYEYRKMFMPVYVNFTYSISIFTQFQQQMNELLQPFITRTGNTRYFLVERDGYKYECFIQPNIDVKNNISSMEEEERRFISNVTLKVLGNLMTQGANEIDSEIKTFENPVEIKLPKDGITVSLREQEDKIKKNILLPGEFDASRIAIKKTFLLQGDGFKSVYDVSHGLNTRDLYVSVRENFGDFQKVEVAIGYQSLNSVEIDMGDPITPGNDFVVTIIG